MLFNTLDFAFFLPLVFAIYWIARSRNIKLQNIIILVASYIFYGWWDWRYLSLIIFSTAVDYFIGLALHKEEKQRKRKVLLWISLGVNLGLLGFLKYYNFFLENFTTVFTFMGGTINASSLNLIIPVGISFYTFQTMSYSLDVYRRKLNPTRDFIAFAAFVSFFPQLVAGPIERASNLLPQFQTKRNFDYTKAVDGLRQILWGLFKKIVIADNCAEFTNAIFDPTLEQTGASIVMGAILFTFQIYCDFSGYSDIAIGTARLFGFNLMQNFNFPYFSRDIAEYWRRWHISLSTWFRDYLYIPLGGSKGGRFKQIRNIFIIFLVSGFWHGANWTYICWSALNALFFLPLLLTNSNRSNLDQVAEGRMLPTLKESALILSTFAFTAFAFIIFRAENMNHALTCIKQLTNEPLSYIRLSSYWQYKVVLLLIAFMMTLEWFGRNGQYAISNFLVKKSRILRWGFYMFLGLLIVLFKGDPQEFIYFQF